MTTSTPLRFLFFDLGNVLLRFDHQIAVDRLAEIAACDSQKVRQIVFESPLQAKYESGQVDTASFCDTFREETGSSATDQQICLAASDIFHVNQSILPLLTALRSVGTPMGILSNTCEAHFDFILERFVPLVQLFNPHVLSYIVGAAKPDKSIYEHAVELVNCKPEEVFFVDDLANNVQGAIDAGLDAVLYTSSLVLVEDLRERGVRFNL